MARKAKSNTPENSELVSPITNSVESNTVIESLREKAGKEAIEALEKGDFEAFMTSVRGKVFSLTEDENNLAIELIQKGRSVLSPEDSRNQGYRVLGLLFGLRERFELIFKKDGTLDLNRVDMLHLAFLADATSISQKIDDTNDAEELGRLKIALEQVQRLTRELNVFSNTKGLSLEQLFMYGKILRFLGKIETIQVLGQEIQARIQELKDNQEKVIYLHHLGVLYSSVTLWEEALEIYQVLRFLDSDNTQEISKIIPILQKLPQFDLDMEEIAKRTGKMLQNSTSSNGTKGKPNRNKGMKKPHK